MPSFVMALLNNVVPFSLVVMGQTRIASGLASVLNATTPLFTVLIMAAFGDEALIARRIVGVLLGVAGVIILRGQEIHASGAPTLSMLMSALAGPIERPWSLPVPSAATWLALLGFAVLSTALAYIVFFEILGRSGATNVVLVTLLIP